MSLSASRASLSFHAAIDLLLCCPQLTNYFTRCLWENACYKRKKRYFAFCNQYANTVHKRYEDASNLCTRHINSSLYESYVRTVNNVTSRKDAAKETPYMIFGDILQIFRVVLTLRECPHPIENHVVSSNDKLQNFLDGTVDKKSNVVDQVFVYSDSDGETKQDLQLTSCKVQSLHAMTALLEAEVSSWRTLPRCLVIGVDEVHVSADHIPYSLQAHKHLFKLCGLICQSEGADGSTSHESWTMPFDKWIHTRLQNCEDKSLTVSTGHDSIETDNKPVVLMYKMQFNI